jgi:hypothetical protein
LKFTHPHQYWVPLIGLYSGARIEEICQLEVNDVRESSGVWIMDINRNGDKRVKTAATLTLVGLSLAALGFRRKLAS